MLAGGETATHASDAVLDLTEVRVQSSVQAERGDEGKLEDKKLTSEGLVNSGRRMFGSGRASSGAGHRGPRRTAYAGLHIGYRCCDTSVILGCDSDS